YGQGSRSHGSRMRIKRACKISDIRSVSCAGRSIPTARESTMSSGMCPYGEEDLLSVALGQQASDEMQAHVAGCSGCQQLLSRLREEAATLRQASERSAAAMAYLPANPQADANRCPGTIGKYFIVGPLGQGAQATTYRALHPELHTELVVKYAKNE